MRFANYEFDLKHDLIGSGQSSQVYKARNVNLDRIDALKILEGHVTIDPEASLRFKREAIHTSHFKHPNIATVYDFDKTEIAGQERSYIVMEFLSGRALDKIIKEQEHSLGYEECMRIAEQVASALAAVHEAGIIHRDLKPGNIMVMSDGHVKLLDFGIARATDESSITQKGMIIGTVLYMSPEQVRGEELGFTSDIFAFGSVLYHLCTGKLPFPGSSFPEVCMTILDCEPEAPAQVLSGFPKPIDAVIQHCLQSEPVDRFSNGRELHTAILGALKEMHSSAFSLPGAEGDLFILPFETASASDELSLGTRKDLAQDLQRTKRLSIHLADAVDAASNTDVDFVLSSKLSTLTKGATLELTLERWGVGESGRAIIQEWDDVLRLDEDDEWALQAGLVRVASRFVRQAMREVIVQPAAELQRDPARADRLANAAHDRLLGGTSKHMFSCIHMIRNALEDNAYSARAYSCLAEAMVRKYLMWDGDEAFLAEAREFANRSLALHHECAEAHTSLGFAYQHSGAPTDAERDYRIAIQIDPTEWMAHSYLGALLARGGNFRHALEHLEQALKIRPQSIGSADNLYLVHMRLGNTDTAITVAKAGIESGLGQLLMCKDDQETRTQTALLHARIGESREAVELINTARELYPKDGFTNFRIACVHAALGKFDDAIRDLTTARDRRYFIRGELLGGTDLAVLRSLPGFDDLLG